MAPVHALIDQIKSELNFYQKSKSGVIPEPGACSAKPAVVIEPTSAELTLKVTTGRTYGAGAGVSIPAGGIVEIKADAKASYETASTQAVTLALEFKPAPNEKELTLVPSSDHPIAQSLMDVRDELLRVHHGVPCIRPKSLTVEINFEVKKKVSAEGGFDFKVVNVSAEYARSSDTVQTLKLTFDMSSGPLLAPQ